MAKTNDEDEVVVELDPVKGYQPELPNPDGEYNSTFATRAKAAGRNKRVETGEKK